MIKKISAIVLALVLCLSVVVMPASAYELGASSEIAYVVELDKDSYSAGETVTIKVFLYGKSGLEFGTGAIIVGCNTAVFDQSENSATAVKGSAVGSALNESYYKAANGSTWAWQTNTTVYNNIVAGNTAAENAMFDQYMKYTIARNTSGTHDNAGSNKNGLPADEINADAENGIPFVSFQLKLKDDIADGTVINVGVPTGAMPKNYCYMNYYSDPGNATGVTKTTKATSEVVNSTTAKVGAPTYTVTYKDGDTVLEKFADVEEGKPTPTIDNPTKPGFFFKGWSQPVADTVTADATYVAEWIPALTIAKDKTQINFDVDGNKLYEGTFAIRQFVEFDNLLDVFGTAAEATNGADGTGLTEIGFVYATTDSYKKADALAVIDAGASSGAYTLDNDAYISTTSKANSFVMGYTVNNIADASVSLTILAYAKYVVNGEEAIATIEIPGDYSEIYSTYESKIPPVNPKA